MYVFTENPFDLLFQFMNSCKQKAITFSYISVSQKYSTRLRCGQSIPIPLLLIGKPELKVLSYNS